jgi:ABC-type polysaccharide transport system permease subunit
MRWQTKLKKNWQLYTFMVLPLAYLILFRYVPMAGAQIAFKKFTLADGIWGSPWVGFDNFIKFFKAFQFRLVITNTVRISFYSLVAGFTIPIILALAMNTMVNQRLKKSIQTIIYIPHFISVVVLVGMLLRIFHVRIGIYGILHMLIFNREAANILARPNMFTHLFVWSGVWQNAGWGTVIYMAALSNVDLELHEAAAIDGASRFKRVVHIDFPTILPTIVILLILNAGNIMNVGFEKVFLMQNDMNLRTSEVISTFVYRMGIRERNDFSYASAIGLFNSVINISMLMLVNAVARRVSDSSLW